jgi:hypothetical protein
MKTDQQIAYFTRFSLEMPAEAINDCSHQGPCDDDVDYWSPRIARPNEITPEALRDELREYGAWDSEELLDDDANWQRLIWIAAGNIREEAAE